MSFVQYLVILNVFPHNERRSVILKQVQDDAILELVL
jgi:hypothetical protein